MEWRNLTRRGRNHAVLIIEIPMWAMKERIVKKHYGIDMTFKHYRQFANKRELSAKDYEMLKGTLDEWMHNDPQKANDLANTAIGFINEFRKTVLEWQSKRPWKKESNWPRLITDFRSLAAKFWAGPIIYSYVIIDEHIIPKIVEELEDIGYQKDDLLRYISPKHKTEMAELVEGLSSGQDLKNLTERFCHLGRYYFWGKGLTTRDLEEMKKNLKTDVKSNRKEKAVKLKVPEHYQKMIDACREFGDFPNKADETVNLAIETLQPMWQGIGRRLKVEYEDVCNMRYCELLESLKIGRCTVSGKELERRRKDHLLWYNSGVIILDTEDIYSEELKKEKADEEDEKELSGKQVSVKQDFFGIARVVNNPRDFENFSKGEILVTPMTNPEFLPAMNKAKAFITDDGGLLCHAAIVAREMKKPCIVGTDKGTRIIKTGDWIETKEGTVRKRILEHKSTRQRVTPFPNYFSMESIMKEMEKVVGKGYSFAMIIFRDRIANWFFDSEDQEEVAEHVFSLVIDDPELFARMNKEVKERGDEFISWIEDVSKRARKLDSRELKEVFSEYKQRYKEIYSHYFAILSCEHKLVGHLKNALENKIKYDKPDELSKRDPEELFSALINEPRAKVNGTERLDALKLAKKISEKKKWKRFFDEDDLKTTVKKIKSDQELDAMFINHCKRYFWITRDYEDPVLGYHDFVQRTRDILTVGFEKELKSRLDENERIKKDIEDIGKTLGKELSREFAALRDGIYLKELRKKYVSISLFYFDSVLEETARRAKVSVNHVRFLKTEEIGRILDAKGNNELKNELAERMRLSSYIVRDEETEVISGEEAELLYDRLVEQKEEKKELKGFGVSSGKARGKARVIMNPDESLRVKKGEIIVTTQIVPSFAPALENAAGVVCDGGTGITAHPAILAREAGIPCVVGVKSGTKNIKDGELIEIDGNLGIVRKIEQQ
jgi:phosphohistidine swiveling domain-containing protein